MQHCNGCGDHFRQRETVISTNIGRFHIGCPRIMHYDDEGNKIEKPRSTKQRVQGPARRN